MAEELLDERDERDEASSELGVLGEAEHLVQRVTGGGQLPRGAERGRHRHEQLHPLLVGCAIREQAQRGRPPPSRGGGGTPDDLTRGRREHRDRFPVARLRALLQMVRARGGEAPWRASSPATRACAASLHPTPACA